MKFTVKKLLGVTFLLALLINGFINIFAIQRLDRQAFQLKVKVPTVQAQTINYQERKAILERAYDAVQSRKDDCQQWQEEFNRIALAKSEFKELDPSRVKANPIPTLSPETADKSYAFRERFRLWLPESGRYQLRVEFRVPVNLEQQLVNEFETESELFDSSSNTLIPIQPGESIVQTEWFADKKSEKVFRMQINGETVFDARTPVQIELEHNFGWGQFNNTSYLAHPTWISGVSYHIAGDSDSSKEAMFFRLISLNEEEVNE